MTPNTAALASALHEIRTPIQTILGTAELLKATSLDSEQQEYVRQIAFSADVIYTLANDIVMTEEMKKPLCYESANQTFEGVFDGDGHTISNLIILIKMILIDLLLFYVKGFFSCQMILR